MRRTLRSQAKPIGVNHTDENIEAPRAANTVQNARKRTLSTIQPSTQVATTNPTPASTGNARASKKARIVGPLHGRPLQLDLSEGNRGGSRGKNKAIDNGRTNPLERTASFYPGRDSRDDEETTEHAPDSYHVSDSNDGDTDVESEEDWLEEPQLGEPATRNSSKASEAATIERPQWLQEDSTPTSNSAPQAGNSGPSNNAVAFPSRWPTETDLLFFPGTKKVMLTVQRPVMRMIIQDAFEQVRKGLLFKNAFPDTWVALDFTRDGLVLAAESHSEGSDIHNRLLCDSEYMFLMTRLPRARIPLFRGEVKERCVALVQAEFMSIGSVSAVTQLVEKQLGNYNYTFAAAQTNNPLNYIAMRTRPYRNARIIAVLRDLFFSGGSSSFAHRFRRQFPVHESDDGTVMREVPVPMVALVATALYAAIQEWRTGEHKAMEFSANAYLDVYNGNVNTFTHIRDNREDAFHLMMCDLYTKASMTVGPTGAAIAELELDNIEA